MKILVSNDDGIFSPGIAALANALAKMGEVIVCAPEREQSAVSRSVTMYRPLRLEKVEVFGMPFPSYTVDGTPTDCVKLALDKLLQGKPDLVVSGINRGANLGSDVLFSGTVAAAMEGAMQGIRAVAVSLEGRRDWNFERAAKLALIAIEAAKDCPLPFGTLMNVNVPDFTPKGYKLTPMGVLDYGESYVERADPRGRRYYWLSGKKKPAQEQADTDDAWLERGYVTITPVKFDMTDYDLLRTWHTQLSHLM